MADILGFMKKTLPWITAAASGNVPALVGLAAQTIGNATGKKVAGTADAIAAAVAGATPEQLAAMKQADLDFQVKMQALGFQNIEDLEKIAADDRASARAREIATKDRIPGILAGFITVGFFSLLFFMIFRPIPDQGHDALLLMLGSLGAAFTGVITYYFGSSAGSAAKTKIMADSSAAAKG